MRCGVFGVTTVNNFCSDGLLYDGARNVKFVTEIDPVPILIVHKQYFPKSTFTDNGCSEKLRVYPKKICTGHVIKIFKDDDDTTTTTNNNNNNNNNNSNSNSSTAIQLFSIYHLLKCSLTTKAIYQTSTKYTKRTTRLH